MLALSVSFYDVQGGEHSRPMAY